MDISKCLFKATQQQNEVEMTIDITYYEKSEEGGPLIATFGIHVPKLNGIYINNISIVKSKNGGWFVNLPSFKNKNMDSWKKIISFESETNQKFVTAIRTAIEEYAKEKEVGLE